jgi:hypothetical protein
VLPRNGNQNRTENHPDIINFALTKGLKNEREI